MLWVGALALSATMFGGSDLTYSHDVKPVLDSHCVECHHAGGRDPDLSSFPFHSGSTSDQGQIVLKMLQKVQQQSDGTEAKMPPGSRPKLTSGEIGVLSGWADQGLKP